MNSGNSDDSRASIDELTKQVRQNQTVPKPGLLTGKSPVQKGLIGCAGLFVGLMALSIAFFLLGLVSPLLIIAIIILVVLAFKRPEAVTGVAGRWPFRLLPTAVTSGPIRFAIVLAVVMTPVSGVAGAAVYGQMLSGSKKGNPSSTVTSAAVTTRTPSPVATAATRVAVITTQTPVLKTPTPTQPAPTPTAAKPTPTPQPSTVAQSSNPTTSNACRTGDPLANVYHPSRLHVQNPCMTVTGTIGLIHADEADGDIHIDIQLDAPFANLINDKNVSGEHGMLVVEIVPADEPGCTIGQPPKPPSGTYDYGICTGANETAPPVGTHVQVTGPYVLDADHGWLEIHPVWSITSIGGVPSTAPAPTSAPPPPVPTPTPVPPAPSGSNIVHPGSFCSPQGATGVTTKGTPMVCEPASDGRLRWKSQ